jgi:hypothetical protein
LRDVTLCCWVKSSHCFEGMCHLHIYGFIAHDMFLQHIRDCLPSNTLSYLKIQNPGFYHHDTSKNTMDLIQKPVMCVCVCVFMISRCFKNQKLQQSILCSVNCIMFICFLKLVCQIFVKRALLFVERKNTSPFNRQGLFSVLIRHIIGELEIGSCLLHQTFGT